MNLIIHTDGGSRGNPGPAAAGVVIQDADTSEIVHEGGYFLGEATNNSAEYQALIRSLEKAIELKAKRIQVFSDSELMVKQITGEYRVKSADLKPLVEQVQMLLLRIDIWNIKHVRREKNLRADELANFAMDAGHDVDGSSPDKKVKKAGAAATGSKEDADNDKSAVSWTARLIRTGGASCPARCSANTPYRFGPSIPTGFCVYAAQAVFDENPTLWPQAGIDTSQTQCPRCSVPIEIKLESTD